MPDIQSVVLQPPDCYTLHYGVEAVAFDGKYVRHLSLAIADAGPHRYFADTGTRYVVREWPWQEEPA